MNRTLLFATASAVALSAGSAVAEQVPLAFVIGKAASLRTVAGGTVLYGQNRKDSGVAIVSQNFTCGSFSPTYNAAAADDFVVPTGEIWIVREVDITGQYFNGSGPATSEDVAFYKDHRGRPGRPKGSFQNVIGTETNGNFAITLPGKGLRLRAGHYWVSVVGNVSFDPGWYPSGEWGWEMTNKQHGDEAMWQNPSGGFGTGCTTWGTIKDCLGYSGDLMFALRGTKN